MSGTADDPNAPRPLASWYYAGAIASFLFMLLGCGVYLLHVTTDPSALPVDERAAFLAIPAWVSGANAIAVWVGLGAAVMLLMKRGLAEKLMLVSLIGAVTWLGGLIAVPATRAAMTANDLAVVIAILAIVWTIYWFARHSRQRGWLR